MKKGIAAIIENFDGTFLLQLRDENAPVLKNQWCLIGGSVKNNEGLEDAVRREVKEESNLNIIGDLKFFRSFRFNNKEISIYYGRVDTRKHKVKIGEGEKLRFFPKTAAIRFIESLSYKNIYLSTIADFVSEKYKH